MYIPLDPVALHFGILPVMSIVGARAHTFNDATVTLFVMIDFKAT